MYLLLNILFTLDILMELSGKCTMPTVSELEIQEGKKQPPILRETLEL